MLVQSQRNVREDNFYLDAGYILAIVNIVDDNILNTETPVLEYIFEPNPTDVDVDLQNPNVIAADQGDGFYVENNPVGVGTVSIRGTTGQFPQKRSSLDFLGNRGNSINKLAQSLGFIQQQNGYTKWIELSNFFSEWNTRIQENPSDYAMLYVNAKDIEIYQVLPMTFRKPRTSARPNTYVYNINLQIIGEHRPGGRYSLKRSWSDQISRIQGEIQRWKHAVNNSIITASYLLNSGISQAVDTTFSPLSGISSTIRSMANGLQSLSYTANIVSNKGTGAIEEFISARDTFKEAVKTAGNVRVKLPGVLSRSVEEIVPPTYNNIKNIYLGVTDILDTSNTYLSGMTSEGTRQITNPEDPFIDQYYSSLDFYIESIMAAGGAPITDDVSTAYTSEETKYIHEVARSGGAEYLYDRENEFSSASLKAETYINDGVRTPKAENTSSQSYSLSYIAASILNNWSRDQNSFLPSEVESFRKAFLGMRDPSTLSPLYKSVIVNSQDTVYSLAEKHLGSWKRWYEIVFINNLKYPYISKHGGIYTKVPGDDIFIPALDSKIPAYVVDNILNIQQVHDRVSIQDVFLGFDVKVSKQGDYIFNGRDFEHVAGVEAFIQELTNVLEGHGGVTPSRFDAPRLNIGSKSNGRTLLMIWHGILKQWLTNDLRVDKLENLSVSQENDLINFSARIKFVDLGDPVTVSSRIKT